jgi:hypothetical protein
MITSLYLKTWLYWHVAVHVLLQVTVCTQRYDKGILSFVRRRHSNAAVMRVSSFPGKCTHSVIRLDNKSFCWVFVSFGNSMKSRSKALWWTLMLSRCLHFVRSVRGIVLQKRILGRRVRRALHRRLAAVTSLDLALGRCRCLHPSKPNHECSHYGIYAT